MKELICQCGSKAQVSDVDYEPLNKFKWHVIHRKGIPYVVRRTKDKIIYLYTEVLKRMSIVALFDIEHGYRDKDTFNNQRSNLVIVFKDEDSTRKNNTSGFTGVCFNKYTQKWQASIEIGGKLIDLGKFVNLADAVEARKAADDRS